MKAFFFSTVLLSVALASSAQAQVDHLQCHKVKDTIKFKGAVVDLTAIQAQFQLPENCTIKSAAEFCVPVSKTVVDQGSAPGSAIGPGNDLTPNDYVCYKIKCSKTTIPDTFVTDQFGARALQKIKTAQKLCVPAVKGVVATTTTTLCVPDCTGKVCGDDGCNGSCGTCTAPDTCVGGVCTTCTPDCTGKNCGSDGCGGSCGTCTTPDMCVGGTCTGTGPICGDGTIDPGETCDPPGTCPTVCNDNDACTADALIGSAANCTAQCGFSPIVACEIGGDGCCPPGCDRFSDIDCGVCLGNELPNTCQSDGCAAGYSCYGEFPALCEGDSCRTTFDCPPGGRCAPAGDPFGCIPGDCSTRECGNDGCAGGESCGSCAAGEACDTSTGQCEPWLFEVTCYSGTAPFGAFSMYYTGPIDTKDNASAYFQSGTCGNPAVLITVVYGATPGAADAKCSGLGFADALPIAGGGLTPTIVDGYYYCSPL